MLDQKPANLPSDTWMLSKGAAKALDQYCDLHELSISILVENAGKGLASEVLKTYQEFPTIQKSNANIIALVGSGNNAADVLVAVRYLHEAGLNLKVFYIFEEGKGSPEYLRNLKLIKQMAIPIAKFSKPEFFAAQPVIVMDGIFGTGFKSPIDDPNVKSVIECINQSTAYVISADIPSGLQSDDGSFDVAVKADKTVSFSSSKFAFMTEKGSELSGLVVNCEVGIPAAFYQKTLSRNQIFRAHHHPIHWDSPISDHSHKFDRGHVVVFAGSPGKMGAAALCSLAAEKAGAGWVTLAVSATFAKSQNLDFSVGGSNVSKSLVLEPLISESGEILGDSLSQLLTTRKTSCLVFGPGWTKNFLDESIMKIIQDYVKGGGSVIFDAGATHNLFPLIEKIPLNPARAIALPHPGEWRKLGGEISKIKMDSFQDLEKASSILLELNSISCVWKSATPIFFAPGLSENIINLFPNHKLAKAGLGDVLAGLTAGLCPRMNHIARAASNGHSALVRAVSAGFFKDDDVINAESILNKISGFN